MKHRWKLPSLAFPTLEECSQCGCTRRPIATVGKRYRRELRTYLRADGTRFTGHAPDCEPSMRELSRPFDKETARIEVSRIHEQPIDGGWYHIF